MPKIQWSGLPPALRDHLFERLREREISAEDLYQLKAWRAAMRPVYDKFKDVIGADLVDAAQAANSKFKAIIRFRL